LRYGYRLGIKMRFYHHEDYKAVGGLFLASGLFSVYVVVFMLFVKLLVMIGWYEGY